MHVLLHREVGIQTGGLALRTEGARAHGATRLAIKRALNNQPTIEELIANRHKIKHDMDDWS